MSGSYIVQLCPHLNESTELEVINYIAQEDEDEALPEWHAGVQNEVKLKGLHLDVYPVSTAFNSCRLLQTKCW